MRHRIIDTFTGPFALMLDDDGSIHTAWVHDETERRLRRSTADRHLQPDLIDRLRRYFDGETDVDFADVPLSGGGEFFRRCWRACRRIPRGQTRTYGQLAVMAGSPSAARAAGQSMRRNELPVIVPCHRVVGCGGRLHGFGGSVNQGGAELAIKRRLLEMEGALADEHALPGLPGRSARSASRRTPALATA